MENNMKKNVIWNMLGTGLNAFISLFLMIMITRINGLNDAGIFSFSFSMACLLYMIGIYAGRIYQVTDTTNISNKEFIANRALTCIIMILLTIMFLLVKRYSIYKTTIFMFLSIYKAIEAFSDVLYGIMQKEEKLENAGKSYFIKSLLTIFIFLIVDLLTHSLILSCVSIVIATVAVTLLYDLNIVTKLTSLKEKINYSNVNKILKEGFIVFVITFITVFMVNIPKYVIDQYLSDEIQAIFGIIIMPATVISLFSQFIIHPVLTTITKLCNKNNYVELKKLMYKIMLMIFVIGLICSFGGYLIGIPVLELVYGVDLKIYRINLFVILIASTISATAGIISPFLIAMRHNLSQLFIGISLVIIETILCFALIKEYSINGACIAYLISMIYNFILFYIVSIRKINKKIKGV